MTSVGGASNTTGAYTKATGTASGSVTGQEARAQGSTSPSGSAIVQGTYSYAFGSAQATIFGTRSVAGTSTSSSVAVYGIHSTVSGNSPITKAGHFDGDVDVDGVLDINGQGFINGVAIISDGTLKENIANAEGSLALVNAIQPRTYTFREGDDVTLNLPTGLQRGVIAQELEEVLPDLVIERTISARVDSTGAVVVPERTLKSVNYIGLIPVLIGAVQEQQAQVAAEQATNAALTDRLAEQEALMAEQSRRLDQLEAALASCCANPANGDTRLLAAPPANGSDDLNKALEGEARHLHIQPNPFTERTTLHYRLERAGRMQLLANSADGKSLKVLQEAALESGAYQFNWETVDLTPGVYYVTLLLDGQPLVKKAVKVMR